MNEGRPPTKRLQISLINLLLIVALVGGGCVVYRTFWRSIGSNYEIVLGGYLAVLAIATVGLLPAESRYRRPMSAAIGFAWAFLVCLLMAAGPFPTLAEANFFVENLQCGTAIAILTLIAARVYLSVVG